jgi:glutamate--cysteine ligase
MQGLCELLVASDLERPYSASLKEQVAKLDAVERTPSARLLVELDRRGESFAALALRVSREHRDRLRGEPLHEPARWQEFEAQAQASLEQQTAMEVSQRGSSFDEYLAAYLAG